jgi:hypothetical protein
MSMNKKPKKNTCLLNFTEPTLSDYSECPYAQERVGAAIIRHTAEGHLNTFEFRTFPTKL